MSLPSALGLFAEGVSKWISRCRVEDHSVIGGIGWRVSSVSKCPCCRNRSVYCWTCGSFHEKRVHFPGQRESHGRPGVFGSLDTPPPGRRRRGSACCNLLRHRARRCECRTHNSERQVFPRRLPDLRPNCLAVESRILAVASEPAIFRQHGSLVGRTKHDDVLDAVPSILVTHQLPCQDPPNRELPRRAQPS